MNKEQVSTLSTVVNIILAGLKISVGLISRSSAIIASGIDSLSDILSSLLVFIGIKMSKKPPSKKYPYGLYRLENISSVVVFVLIMISSLGIIIESIDKILTSSFETQVSVISMTVMLISALVCASMASLKIRVGKAEDSLSLILDGKHTFIDVLSSIAVIVGLILSNIFKFLDPVVALIIGVYIFIEGAKLGKEVFEGLMDTADLEVEKQVKNLCVEEEVKVTNIKSRKVAGRVFIEMTISLPKNVKIERADNLVDELQKKIINRVERVERVVIQVKGGDKRYRLLRGGEAEKFYNEDEKIFDKVNLPKKGFRRIKPFRRGGVSEDFGSPSYLVSDERNGEIIQKRLVRNPFYKVGRGHGVRFARAMNADQVEAKNISYNARGALRRHGIKFN